MSEAVPTASPRRPSPRGHHIITRALAAAAAATIALGLAACSSNGDAGASQQDEEATVTVRLWDPNVAKAYEASFEKFHDAHPNITVEVNQIPWADYWTKLRTDISAGSVDDVFWVNGYNFTTYADNGKLAEIGDEFADQKSSWAQSAIDLYTRNGKLWGVPQLIDGGKVLYYNKDLVAKAGVSLDDLHWDPDDPSKDTLLPALQKLTVDANGVTADQPGFDSSKIVQYGFNAASSFDDIVGSFVGSNGGRYQEGDKYVFADDPKTVQAIGYVADLINKYHVAPSADDTNENSDFSRDQFLQGKIAVLQSGSNNLANVDEGATFDWGISRIAEGPAGRISATNSIIAAANPDTDHQQAVTTVLRWLGSAEGNGDVGASGSAIPAVADAQQSYFDYWDSKGVDGHVFLDAAAEGTLPNPAVPNALAANADLTAALNKVYAGRIEGSLEDALKAAQDHANEQAGGA